MESVRDQLSTLIHMIAGGLITGLLFDLYPAGAVIRPHRLMTDLGDLLFWAVTTIVMFIILVNDNWGQGPRVRVSRLGCGAALLQSGSRSSFIYLILGVARLFGRMADSLSRARIAVSRSMARLPKRQSQVSSSAGRSTATAGAARRLARDLRLPPNRGAERRSCHLGSRRSSGGPCIAGKKKSDLLQLKKGNREFCRKIVDVLS